MSKPVTSEEVEDVLSSIRRLVSEDKRPLAGLRSASVVAETVAPEAPEPQVTPEVADRFVLTPALRVASNQDDTPIEVDDGPLDLGSVTRGTWTNSADTASEVEDEDHGNDEPMMLFPSDIAAASTRTDGLDALVQNTLDSETHGADDEPQDDEDYADEGYWDVEEAPFHDTDERISGVEDETDLSDWDIDASEVTQDTDDAFDGLRATDVGVNTADFATDDLSEGNSLQRAEDQHEPVEEPRTASSEELFFEPELDESLEASSQMASSIPLTAKIAALEAAVGEIASGWEPDGDEIETLAATVAPAMAWEDDLQLDAKGAPLHEDAIEETAEAEAKADETAEASAPIGGFGADDQLMDEDALRALVSEIVRAELQGALGERITRNVRKLVRREIHRALTAQEME